LQPPNAPFEVKDATPDSVTVLRSPEPLIAPSPFAPPQPINRVVGGLGKGFPNTDAYYPPSSRRLGETGAATLQVCVDGTGRLTSAPTLIQSSGSTRLDGGALKLAQAGSGHYRATTENGEPVDSCFGVRITFQLVEAR
jgi:TonB family protein